MFNAWVDFQGLGKFLICNIHCFVINALPVAIPHNLFSNFVDKEFGGKIWGQILYIYFFYNSGSDLS